MTIVDLSDDELRLVVALREEAERITKGLSQEQQAEALSQLYAWRNEKIVTQAERSKNGR